MMKRLFFLPLILMFFACGQQENGEQALNPNELMQKISDDRELLAEYEVGERKRTEVAIRLLGHMNDFIESYPDHNDTPDLLYSAGNHAAYELGDYRKAVDHFMHLIDNHPEYEKAPEALFTAAYLYEGPLDNLPRAESAYKRFISDYPEHELHDDAAFALQNLGRDPADMVREFREREKEGS